MATRTYPYNGAAAVAYAARWYNGHNLAQYPKHWDVPGEGDCENFVSQCLRAGGIQMRVEGSDNAGAPLNQLPWYYLVDNLGSEVEVSSIESVRGRYGGGYKVSDWYSPQLRTLCVEQIQVLKKVSFLVSREERLVIGTILEQFAP